MLLKGNKLDGTLKYSSEKVLCASWKQVYKGLIGRTLDHPVVTTSSKQVGTRSWTPGALRSQAPHAGLEKSFEKKAMEKSPPLWILKN